MKTVSGMVRRAVGLSGDRGPRLYGYWVVRGVGCRQDRTLLGYGWSRESERRALRGFSRFLGGLGVDETVALSTDRDETQYAEVLSQQCDRP